MSFFKSDTFTTMPEEHDRQLRSWVESAEDPQTDFPIQNLPYGVFRRTDSDLPSIGVAIGDRILDLRKCAVSGLLDALGQQSVLACQQPTLNNLMGLGQSRWDPLRSRITSLLSADSSELHQNRAAVTPMLSNMDDCEMLLPAAIGDYTDFYASIDHARNVGALFRPDNPLMPNYRYLPIGYHGRASSIVVSGTPVFRPSGQAKDADAAHPSFGPSRALDYELEVGFFVGSGNPLGQPISLEAADSHLFGLCLMNDWSARDIQAWEYQPLGPFLSKSFGTTISPWIVPMQALAPFRVPALQRANDDPALASYLVSEQNIRAGGIDLNLEVVLSSRQMRERGMAPRRVCRSNLRHLYWTPGQMVAHHTVGGCNLRPGDLLGSGTVSGATRDSLGCLLELTRRGREPMSLPTDEQRGFLQDGDEVIMRGYCMRQGFRRIGFGDCCGTIVARENADE